MAARIGVHLHRTRLIGFALIRQRRIALRRQSEIERVGGLPLASGQVLLHRNRVLQGNRLQRVSDGRVQRARIGIGRPHHLLGQVDIVSHIGDVISVITRDFRHGIRVSRNQVVDSRLPTIALIQRDYATDVLQLSIGIAALLTLQLHRNGTVIMLARTIRPLLDDLDLAELHLHHRMRILDFSRCA